MYWDVLDYLISEENVGRKCLVSNVQRKFSLGFGRACRICEQLEEDGMISEYRGENCIPMYREVVVSKNKWINGKVYIFNIYT